MEQGRIMVVDDDPFLLHFIAKYLSRLGYSVTACGGGQEAWKLFSHAEEPFPLAVVDVSLPGIPGAQLAQMMLDHNPDSRLVLTSGYPMDMEALRGEAGRTALLQKPFTPAMLVDTIAALLRAKGAGRC